MTTSAVLGASPILSSQTYQISSDGSCCAGPVPSSPEQTPAMQRLEVVCRLALGALAIRINSVVGLGAMALGAVHGAASHLYSIVKLGKLPEQGYRRPVCAQGYMETLSGRTYSKETNLIVTALFIAVHIMHYPPFFVPFTTLCVGMWLGGTAVRFTWQTVKAPI
jgi:hypothetical protein